MAGRKPTPLSKSKAKTKAHQSPKASRSKHPDPRLSQLGNYPLDQFASTGVTNEKPPVRANSILSNYFGYCLAKALVHLRQNLMTEFAKLDLFVPQAGMLDILAQRGPLTQLGLGEQCGIDKATMVKMIDSLEDKGLVERKVDPTDRRAKQIELTTKGRKLLGPIKETRLRVESKFLKALTKEEATVFKAMTKKIFLSHYD